jgi:hypothetical protein
MWSMLTHCVVLLLVCMTAGRLASQIQALLLKMQRVAASSWGCSAEGQVVPH